jgi:hypothetical protein
MLESDGWAAYVEAPEAATVSDLSGRGKCSISVGEGSQWVRPDEAHCSQVLYHIMPHFYPLNHKKHVAYWVVCLFLLYKPSRGKHFAYPINVLTLSHEPFVLSTSKRDCTGKEVPFEIAREKV